MGEHKSLNSHIHTENPETCIARCNCRLAHIAACKGGQGCCSATGFDCEEHQIDLFYFFKNSTRKKGIVAEYLEFVGSEWENFSRFVWTIWFSLETCRDKELRKVEGLKVNVYEPIREILKMWYRHRVILTCGSEVK